MPLDILLMKQIINNNMIDIKTNFSLKEFNTFGLDVRADKYVKYDTKSDLKNYLKTTKLKKPFLILGGGSNLLFDGDYNGVVLHSFINHIRIVKENEESVLICVGAGVEWDALVSWSIDNNFYGIENLSYIPGSVGAAPVQNVGAYGVEIKDVFFKVDGLIVANGDDISLDYSQMRFGYRDSIFKNKMKDRVIITDVYLRLLKNGKLNLDYGSVNEHVQNHGGPTLQNVRYAINAIRMSKLPDPQELANAGSFFKNPIISNSAFEKIKAEYPYVPHYIMKDHSVKIPAAWLIETCGWRGKEEGNVAVHEDQALVIINKGDADGLEILKFAKKIEEDVRKKFSIKLEKEITVVSSSI